MAQQPHEPIFSVGKQGVDRRSFLKYAGLLSLFLSGCSEDGTNGNPTGSAGGGANSNPAGNQAAASSGLPLSGRVSMQDFGGGPLTVQSVYQQLATVGTDGNFTTLVTPNRVPQLIFLTGQASTNRQLNRDDLSDFFPGPLKGLGLYLPGVEEAFELTLNSTAVAVVFLTFGILTTDLTEAASRIRRILALNSFSALVASLGTILRTGSLADAGNNADFLRLKQICIDEFFTTPAKSLSQEEFDRLIPQGLLTLQKGEVDAQNRQSIDFENHGFRWVTVIRQELDGSGNEPVPHTKPRLLGANVGATTVGSLANGLLGGGNTLGWGNLFTKQIEDPGLGTDLFVPSAQTTRVRYWAMGPGHGDIASVLPDEIDPSEFGYLGYFMTGFYYFILPLFDIVTGGVAGIAVHRLGHKFFTHENVENLESILELATGNVGIATAGDGLIASYRTGNEGNITSGWIDLLAASIGLLATVARQIFTTLMAEAIAAAAAAENFGELLLLTLEAELVAGALGALLYFFAVSGLAIAGFNFTRAIRDHVRLPSVTALTAVIRSAPYDLVSFPLPQPELSELANALSFNDQNDVLILRFSGSDGGTSLWRPLLGGVLDPSRELVGPFPHTQVNNPQDYAFINNNGYVAYLGYNQDQIRYVTLVRRGPNAQFVLLDDARLNGRFYPVPYGLNNDNLLVGVVNDAGRSQGTGGLFTYRLDDNFLTLVDLPAKLQMPDVKAGLLDVNDLGHVVGNLYVFESPVGLFVYLPDGTARMLATPEEVGRFGSPVAINNQGHILYRRANGTLRIVDLAGNLVRDLAPPASDLTNIQFNSGSFNDSDQVVALASRGSEGVALFWDSDGAPRELSAELSFNFFPSRINNSGTILGGYLPPGQFGRVALLVPRR